MDIQGLKDKILQLAIQGKLVEQDKNDEPASVLLERIKEERDKLVREKKIKKEKPLPGITEEEKPFEIPEGWEWVRFGDITRICLGLTHRPEYVENGIPFLSVKDISSGIISFSNCRFIEVDKYKSLPDGSKPQKGDVLFGRVGTLGKPSIVEVDFPFGIFVSLGFLRPYIINMNIYLKVFMESKLFFDQIYANVFGSAQINLNTGWLSNFLIPLPPLAEQKRIVEKVDELFALIDEIDSNKEDLLEVINLTRNQVLQEAIQGKLVEQNPEDEPASLLLERIKEERDNLVKEGKIKKQKPLPEITEEEKPFKLPEGWEWVRLGEIIDLISGRDLPVADCNAEGIGIPYIMGASNIENGNLLIERWIDKPQVIAQRDDLIITVKGTVGKIILLKEYEEVNLSRQVMGIRQIYNDYPYYLYYFVKSHLSKIINKSQGVIPGISRDDILGIVFPLPPLAEQKRIVEKVDEIMNMLDELENKIVINI